MTASRRDTKNTMVALIALAIFIHALDRGNFATAAPLIKDSLALSNTQIGLLLSAFFWTYVPGHILAGWLIEKLNPYRTLALGLAVWALATLLTGFATGFAMLLVLRLLLGIGESAGFPASSKLLAQELPADRLTAANGMVGAGLMLGNGAGVLLGGMLLAAVGWHALFFVFGGLSLLWLVPWLLASPRSSARADAGPAPAAPPYRELLARRETWGAMLGMFCANYPYFIVLSWLPLYLVKQQGYSLTAMAWLAGGVYGLAALINWIGGRLADRAIAQGADAGRVRQRLAAGCCGVAMLCMLACALGGPEVAIGGLAAYSLAIGLGPIGTFTTGQILAGPRAAGKWMGLQNGMGGLSGVFGPLITGMLIDATGDYRIAFLFAALMALAGILCWGLLIRRVEPLVWSD